MVKRSRSSASFQREEPIAGKGNAMKKTDAETIRYDVDLANLPPLSEKQKAELAALADMPDSEIDYSDVPELSEGQFRNAVRGRFYRPVKQQITARVDADVLAWLKAAGKGLSGPDECDPSARNAGIAQIAPSSIAPALRVSESEMGKNVSRFRSCRPIALFATHYSLLALLINSPCATCRECRARRPGCRCRRSRRFRCASCRRRP